MIINKNKTGITLLELITTVTLLGVLVALLLPAISKVRAAAQQARSLNNLRQINLSFHQLMSQQSEQVKKLPDASRTQYKVAVDQLSIFSQLLPFLVPNRTPLPNKDIVTSQDIQNYFEPRVPTYIDPADPSVALLQEPSFHNVTAAISYAANQMAFDKYLSYPFSIPDGASTTIGFAQHYFVCRLNESYHRYDQVFATPPVRLSDGFRRATIADYGWYDVMPVVENGVARPSVPGHTFQYMPKVEEAWGKVAQTPHPGGLPVGLFDGSVRTLRPGIAESVYWALVTPAGGEVVGDF